MKRVYTLLTFILVLAFSISSFARQKLTLDEAITAALTNNTQVVNSKSQLALNKAQRLGAWSGVLPNIRFSGTPFRQYRAPSTFEGFVTVGVDPETGQVIQEKRVVTNPENTTINYSGGFSINHTVWDMGSSVRSIQSASAGARSAEYNYQNAAVTTIFTVQQSYYNLLKLIEQRKVLVEALTQAERTKLNSENLYSVGSVPQGDVFRADVSVGNNKIAIIDHDVRIETAKQQLNLAMGREINAPVDVETGVNLDVDYTVNLDDMLTQALNLNPGIRGFEESVSASALSLKSSKGNRYPALSYNISYNRSNSDLGRIYEDFSRNYSVNMSATLSWNLFDGFRTRSNVQQATHGLKISEENLENARRTTHSNVRQYYLQLVAFQEKINLSELIVKSAEEDFRLADETYRIGAGTLLDVISARSGLVNNQFNLVSLKHDAKIAEAQLTSAIGSMPERYASLINDN